MKKLQNRVAVVTGGSSGIGRSISHLFALEGARVFNLDIQAADDKGIIFMPCDVSDQEKTSHAFNGIMSREGSIDILINNAGISHIGTVETTPEEDFDRIYRVNIKGVYNCLYSCIPHMKRSGGGIIINMSSIAAEVGLPDRFAYSMSKGAVSMMTLSVARDYLQDNIRCMAIAPARIHTPFVDDFLARNYPGREKEMFEKLAKTQPLGRMGKPEEVARFALYLCSEEAGFMTGSIYPIDGGFIKINT